MCETQYVRGDILVVDNPIKEKHGHVLTGTHHAILIQNNQGNTCSDNLVVAYITTNLSRADIPTNVILYKYKHLRPCMVMTGQLQTVAKEDVLSKVGTLRPVDMKRIDQALCVSLGLEV